MRRKEKLVLWPDYFEASNTWREGRRIPKSLAIRGVKGSEIFKAAMELGLNPELNETSAYSRKPWEKNGLVLVRKNKKKSEIIKELAKQIRVNRTSK